MTTPRRDCPPLEALLHAAEGDPRRAHADGCPACRTALVSYRDFMEEDAGDADVDARLDAFIDDLVPEPRRAAPVRLWMPVAAAAVLALAAGLGVFEREPTFEAPGDVLRGEPAAATVAAATRTDDGGLELSWSAPDGTDGAIVAWYDADLVVLARTMAADGDLEVEADDVPAGARSWQVIHTLAGDEVARGPVMAIPD